jgi:hypothetical protein
MNELICLEPQLKNTLMPFLCAGPYTASSLLRSFKGPIYEIGEKTTDQHFDTMMSAVITLRELHTSVRPSTS